MEVRGIDHVLLAMPAGDEAQARRFYAGVLGLAEIEKPEPLASRGGCWFRTGRTIIHIGVQDGFIPAAKAHPALLVEDLETAIEELEQAGVRVQPDLELPDTARCYTWDPFGNRIELIQDGQGFSQR